MGPWPFVSGKLAECLDSSFLDGLICVARAEAASPAVGSKAVHEFEQQELLRVALER
jgi:2-oxoglutarate dehydrogenase complex dehydrogenase (E1) component-like enzyme